MNPPISTKRTIASYFNSLNVEKTTTYDVEHPGPDLEQAQTYDGVKLVN